MRERAAGLPVPPPGVTWEQWKGTPEWAARTREELRVHAEGEIASSEIVRSYLEEVREFKAWSLLTSADGKPFKSFRDLCEHPRPEGLGVPFSRLEPLWKRAADVRPARDRGRPTREKTVLGNTDSSYQSQSADGLLSRIARDAPDVLEAVRAGEFPSARSAAKAAGIPVSDPGKRTVYLPQDAQAAADRLADKFGATWCESLLPCLTKSIRARRDVP